MKFYVFSRLIWFKLRNSEFWRHWIATNQWFFKLSSFFSSKSCVDMLCVFLHVDEGYCFQNQSVTCVVLNLESCFGFQSHYVCLEHRQAAASHGLTFNRGWAESVLFWCRDRQFWARRKSSHSQSWVVADSTRSQKKMAPDCVKVFSLFPCQPVWLSVEEYWKYSNNIYWSAGTAYTWGAEYQIMLGGIAFNCHFLAQANTSPYKYL